MEKIIREYNVYNYDELDENIKEDLLRKENEYQFETYCDLFLEEDMSEKAIELLQKYFGDKATFNRVYYSLSYCQGDGAMIEFDLYYYGKFVKVRQSGHYYHSRAFTIDDITTYSEYLTDKQEKQLYEKIVKMNEELEKYGWELVDTDNHNFDETSLENLREHKYLENGEYFD